MNDKKDNIIKIDFCAGKKTEVISKKDVINSLMPKRTIKKTLFPYLTLPFDLKSNSLVIIGDEGLSTSFLDMIPGKKICYEKKNIQSLVVLETTDSIAKLCNHYELFVPDKAQTCKTKLYLSNLDMKGIELFNLLKKQENISDLRPWTQIYKKVIDFAIANRSALKSSKEYYDKSETKSFQHYFDDEYQDKLNQLLIKENLRVPLSVLKINDLI